MALEAQITEVEGNCIRGTMNDKAVDLFQVCLQGAISTVYIKLLYTCRECHTNDLAGMKNACWATSSLLIRDLSTIVAQRVLIAGASISVH